MRGARDATDARPGGGLVRVSDVLRSAFHGLSANKLRSALTTLGIMIGVGSVILLVAVGNGSAKQSRRTSNASGPTP